MLTTSIHRINVRFSLTEYQLWGKMSQGKQYIFTLKITGFKVDTRNKILSFFQFLFCLQNSKKKFLCHHIAYKWFGGHYEVY